MRRFQISPHRYPDAFGLADTVPTPAAPADAMSTAMDAKLKTFKSALIEDAVKVAAVQIGVSVALMVLSYEIMVFVPIGTIIGAVLSIIQYFGGHYAKREIKGVIADTIAQIKRNAEASQQPVRALARQAAEDEYPAAQILAASGQELGDEWGSAVGRPIAHALQQVVRPIARPAATAVTSAVQFVGDQFLKQAITGAHLVGDKKGEERARRAEATWKSKADYFKKESIRLAGNPIELTRELHAYPATLLMGTSGIKVAIKKCRDLSAAADVALAKMSAEASASIASPEYRLALRISLAKGIRQDPTELAKAQVIAQIEQQAAATVGRVDQAADAGVASPPAPGGGVLSLLAVVGGYLWLNK